MYQAKQEKQPRRRMATLESTQPRPNLKLDKTNLLGSKENLQRKQKFPENYKNNSKSLSQRIDYERPDKQPDRKYKSADPRIKPQELERKQKPNKADSLSRPVLYEKHGLAKSEQNLSPRHKHYERKLSQQFSQQNKNNRADSSEEEEESSQDDNEDEPDGKKIIH